jgi:hypothetical protein
MAEQALGPGGTMTRNRAFFGLLDANGWGWATVKAAFWFVVIIMLMAYIPDRALYATVQPTIDIGVPLKTLAGVEMTPVNFCPADGGQGALPCPAPAGATLPWTPGGSPELSLPAARASGAILGAGLQTLYIGGTDGSAPQATVFATQIASDGQLSAWTQGPPLPAPRVDAAAAFFSGTAYVIGGTGADGKPTDTVFAGAPDAATGKIAAWAESADLKLPAVRSGATVVVASDGLFLIGGTDGTAPTDTVWKATLNAVSGKLGKWTAQNPLQQQFQGGAVGPATRVHASATLSGANVFVWGGEDEAGPTPTILQGRVSALKETLGQITGWHTATTSEQLPAARAGAFGWVANGTLYYGGGEGAQGQIWWSAPNASGNLPGWHTLAASDFSSAVGIRRAAALVASGHAYVFGGETATGVTSGVARSSLSPKPPFFQAGLFFVVVPALGIGGEVGQQLSYLSAAGVATVDFVILLLIGYAYNHKAQTRAFFARLRNRRRRA